MTGRELSMAQIFGLEILLSLAFGWDRKTAVGE
jgi:hypothetical protein